MIGDRDSERLSFFNVENRSSILDLADDLDLVGAHFRQTARNRDRIPCQIKQHGIEGVAGFCILRYLTKLGHGFGLAYS